MAAGLLLAPLVRQPWHLYVTLGVLVGGGSVCLGYTGQALFLPNWFVRRRGLAMSIAFSGVGRGLDHPAALAAEPDRRRGLARRLLDAGRPGAGRCWCRSTCCCSAARGSRPRARRRPRARAADGRRAAPPTSWTPAWVAVDWTLAARDAHGALLVDRARLLLRPLRLVRGAGAPDEVPDRDRLQRDATPPGRSGS